MLHSNIVDMEKNSIFAIKIIMMNKGIHNVTKRMMTTLVVTMIGATAWTQTVPLVYNTENTKVDSVL